MSFFKDLILFTIIMHNTRVLHIVEVVKEPSVYFRGYKWMLIFLIMCIIHGNLKLICYSIYNKQEGPKDPMSLTWEKRSRVHSEAIYIGPLM